MLSRCASETGPGVDSPPRCTCNGSRRRQGQRQERGHAPFRRPATADCRCDWAAPPNMPPQANHAATNHATTLPPLSPAPKPSPQTSHTHLQGEGEDGSLAAAGGHSDGPPMRLHQLLHQVEAQPCTAVPPRLAHVHLQYRQTDKRVSRAERRRGGGVSRQADGRAGCTAAAAQHYSTASPAPAPGASSLPSPAQRAQRCPRARHSLPAYPSTCPPPHTTHPHHHHRPPVQRAQRCPPASPQGCRSRCRAQTRTRCPPQQTRGRLPRCRPAGWQAGRQGGRRAGRQAGGQAGWQAGRQAGGQAGEKVGCGMQSRGGAMGGAASERQSAPRCLEQHPTLCTPPQLPTQGKPPTSTPPAHPIHPLTRSVNLQALPMRLYSTCTMRLVSPTTCRAGRSRREQRAEGRGQGQEIAHNQAGPQGTGWGMFWCQQSKARHTGSC